MRIRSTVRIRRGAAARWPPAEIRDGGATRPPTPARASSARSSRRLKPRRSEVIPSATVTGRTPAAGRRTRTPGRPADRGGDRRRSRPGAPADRRCGRAARPSPRSGGVRPGSPGRRPRSSRGAAVRRRRPRPSVSPALRARRAATRFSSSPTGHRRMLAEPPPSATATRGEVAQAGSEIEQRERDPGRHVPERAAQSEAHGRGAAEPPVRARDVPERFRDRRGIRRGSSSSSVPMGVIERALIDHPSAA